MLDILKAKFVDRQAAAPEWKLVHRQSDAVVPAMRTVYERAVRAVVEATPWDEVEARLEASRLDVDDLIPWGSVGSMALFVPWTRLLGPLFMRMGRITSRRLPVFTKRRTLVAGIFDEANQRAVTWAERNAADLVVVHTDTQRLAIREAVLAGFEQGLPPRAMALDLRRLVGHTARDARAVIKRRVDLQVAGLASERVTFEVNAYAQRLLRRRSQNIARTETIKASVQGQLEGWRQNREARTLSRDLVKEWIVTPDDRLCPICAPLDEVQVDVDGMFTTSIGRVAGPPAHPSCRCALGLNPPRRGTLRPARPPDLPQRLELPPPQPPPFGPGLPRPRRPVRVARPPAVPPARPRVPVRRPVTPQLPPPVPVPPSRPTPVPSSTSPLATGNATSIKKLRKGGINSSFKVDMITADGRKATGVWKPVSGEKFTGVRRTITNKTLTLAEREELAWKVDQALGTDIVPETVFRTLSAPGRPPGEPGSMQFFKRGFVEEVEWNGRALTTDERYRLTVLDMVTGNTDRHAKNYMRSKVSGQAVGIDHGYSFPNASARDPGGFEQFRSRPAGEIGTRTNDPMPEALRRRLLDRVRTTNWESIMTRLSDSERQAMQWRLDFLEQRLEANDFVDLFRFYRGGFGLNVRP